MQTLRLKAQRTWTLLKIVSSRQQETENTSVHRKDVHAPANYYNVLSRGDM